MEEVARSVSRAQLEQVYGIHLPAPAEHEDANRSLWSLLERYCGCCTALFICRTMTALLLVLGCGNGNSMLLPMMRTATGFLLLPVQSLSVGCSKVAAG